MYINITYQNLILFIDYDLERFQLINNRQKHFSYSKST